MNPGEAKIVRTADEVERAHALLSGLVTRQLELGQDEAYRQAAAIALDVLCWLLGHDHNSQFGKQLAEIEQDARAAGYELTLRTGGNGGAH